MQTDRQFHHKQILKTTSIKIKQGFTMAEALITLAIIGLLVALTIPTMLSSTEKYDVLYRAAFQLFEKVTDETLNDKSLYSTQNLYNYRTIGIGCPFVTGIASKLNTIGPVVCPVDSSTIMFTTSNGMTWYNIENGNSTMFGATIPNTWTWLVDVNGAKKPNVIGKDRLYIQINIAGKISPPPQAPENTYVSR